jgi:hypothetical protein
MLHIWCIELAYDAPYMVHHGASTLKKIFEKRLFEKLIKNVQFRARAHSSKNHAHVRVRENFEFFGTMLVRQRALVCACACNFTCNFNLNLVF